MALKHLSKPGSDDALSNSGSANSGGMLRKAALFRVDSEGNIIKNRAGVFALNPSSYEENKSANWSQQAVPGQSDPILQWVNSGARTVSFEALVTADTSYFQSGVTTKPGEETDPVKKTLNQIGQIASAFFKVTLPPPRQTTQVAANQGDSLDISAYLDYYRSLLYPTYDNATNPTKLRYSPPLLVLYAGKSIIKVPYENRISSQHDLWVLTDLKIRITKQLPNLAPMEAQVQFTLVQYNIRSFDTNRFTR